MIPVFSIQSWFSLFYHRRVNIYDSYWWTHLPKIESLTPYPYCSAALYIRTFRELYEAFVLSSFLYYIFELLGGEEQLALNLRSKDAKYGRHGLISRFFFKGDWQMGRPFMMNCKFGVLQYVLVKIIATIVVVVLESLGKYHQEDWSWLSPAIYMVILINVRWASSLYS